MDDALSVSNVGSAVNRRWLLLSKLKQGLSKDKEGHGRKLFHTGSKRVLIIFVSYFFFFFQNLLTNKAEGKRGKKKLVKWLVRCT